MDDFQPTLLPSITTRHFDRPAPAIDALTRRPHRIRIPEFPRFKPLELADRFEVEQWVNRFPPYSDFNFVSLWSWNTHSQFELSWLNDNLVVLFTDYMSGERFLSFLGTTAPDRTADALLDFAVIHGFVPELRLLPETTARAIAPSAGAQLVPAPEHDDYVLSTAAWSALEGKSFRNKRNEISRLVRDHDAECRPVDLGDDEIRRGVMEIFGRWVVQREMAGRSDTALESIAVRRVFTLPRPGELLAFGVYAGGRLVAYSINERLNDGYAMGHHWKADPDFTGAYPLMLRDTCRTFAREGVTFLNIQQDLGEPGLATAKQLYRPARRLHKYRLSAELRLVRETGIDDFRSLDHRRTVLAG